MNLTETNAIITELHEAFPHLSKRFTWAPRVVTEWTKALRPLSAQTVSEGISRWIHANDREPTLAQFLDLLDTLATERQRAVAHHRTASASATAFLLAETMATATLGAQNADDIAWGQLHEQILRRGWATGTPAHAEKRAQLYREFADKHPALAGLALQTAEQWGG